MMQDLKEEVILYRGLKDFSIDEFEIGVVFSNIGGFQSSSFNKLVARKYAGENGVVLIIKATVGTKGVCMHECTTNPNDNEFLLDYRYDCIPYKIDKENNEIYVNLKLKDTFVN